MSGTFWWRGEELQLLDHPYNTTALNERAIEVPIALHWLSRLNKWTGDGLEVGNVLSHYEDHALRMAPPRRIVDLYEEAPGVYNVDVRDVKESYDWIVAISTLEHVDSPFGDPDPNGPIQALFHLMSLLRPGGEMLVTVPFGQQPYMDGAILSGGFEPRWEGTMILESGSWREHNGMRLWRPIREMAWPTSVWVATWRRGESSGA